MHTHIYIYIYISTFHYNTDYTILYSSLYKRRNVHFDHSVIMRWLHGVFPWHRLQGPNAHNDLGADEGETGTGGASMSKC